MSRVCYRQKQKITVSNPLKVLSRCSVNDDFETANGKEPIQGIL